MIWEVIKMSIQAGTPLLLATLGEVYAEKSGILNLGIEGMMAVGAFTAFATTVVTGNAWLGLFLASVVGGLLSLIHGFVSITLKGNQIVSGLALTIFGLGLSGLFGRAYIGLTINRINTLFIFDPIVYLSFGLAVVMWFLLFKTKFGIAVRAVGDNPSAADSLGVNVFLIRYVCTFIGGVLAGLAGGYLSVVYTPGWIEGMTAGRGWIANALTIFAMWDPLKAVIGAYLFGSIDALSFVLQPYGIPVNVLKMLPYAVTILVLVAVSKESIRKRVGAPAALGLPYSRE